MKFPRISSIIALCVLAGAALSGCALVDERQDDCPEEITLACSINMVNNEEEELDEKLGTPHDRPLREALEDYLTDVFATTTHEVDLLFYDQRSRGKMTYRHKDVMDAGQKVITVRVPASDYRVVGVSNLSAVPMLSLKDEESSAGAAVVQKLSAKAVPSHPAAAFTARKRILVRDRDDQEFDMYFYMANSAAALVLNRDSCDVKSIRAEYIGLGDTFKVLDSAYTFDQQAVIQADNVDASPYAVSEEDVSMDADPFIYDIFWELWTKMPLMVCGVGFPSPNVSSEVVGIYPKIWTIDLYVTLEDDSVTRSQIYIGRPLVAGSLMIIKGWICADGSFTPRPEHEPYNPGPGGPDEPPADTTVVGVSVTLKWKQGTEYNPSV